jgi:TRAP-type C4-dicarboxylate transport system substrate-binding protein
MNQPSTGEARVVTGLKTDNPLRMARTAVSVPERSRPWRLGATGACVLFLLAGGPAQAAGSYTLRLASWGAPTAPQVVDFTTTFKDEVEKTSGGQITVQTFPAGSLVNERAVPTAIQSGVVDISLTTMGSWSSIVPTAGALNTVFFRPTAENFDHVIGPGTSLFKALDDDMAGHGVRLLAALYNGPVVVVSKTPMKSPDDFKGKTVRVFDRLTAEIVQALGGAPSTIEVADVYPALQRGTVQAAIGGLEGAIGLKEYEVGKYLLATNGQFGLLLTGYVMNKKSLDALPSDMQKIVLNAAYDASRHATQAMIAAYEKELSQMQEHGMTVTVLQPEAPEYKQFADALASLAKTQEARFPEPLTRAVLDAQK